MFLKQALSHIFIYQNGSCVSTLYKNTQTRAPESSHDTIIPFIETLEFKRFLKVTLSHILLS